MNRREFASLSLLGILGLTINPHPAGDRLIYRVDAHIPPGTFSQHIYRTHMKHLEPGDYMMMKEPDGTIVANNKGRFIFRVVDKPYWNGKTWEVNTEI